MSHTITVDPQLQLVEVVYRGPLTLGARLAAMREGAELLARHGFLRVLVDLRDAIVAAEPDGPEPDLSRSVAQAPLVAGSRLAYLARPHQVANLRAETMAAARHRGLRHFTTRDEALRWLGALPSDA